MCYSKEVQLASAAIIILSALVFYFVYKKRFTGKNKWLTGVLNYILLGFLMIGLHQLFEFLALVSESSIVYKIGLIISIFSTYFALRSLEVMANQKMHSYLVLMVICAIALYIMIIPVKFAAASFYVRHYSVFLWSIVYLFLFLYWNACALYHAKRFCIKKRAVLYYLLSLADLSFILGVIYVLIGFYFLNVQACTDLPSIWCTFFVVQALVLPAFLYYLPTLVKKPSKGVAALKVSLLLFIVALIICGLVMLILPYFDCLAIKFAFP